MLDGWAGVRREVQGSEAKAKEQRRVTEIDGTECGVLIGSRQVVVAACRVVFQPSDAVGGVEKSVWAAKPPSSPAACPRLRITLCKLGLGVASKEHGGGLGPGKPAPSKTFLASPGTS